MSREYKVYKLTNKITGKIYIGQTYEKLNKRLTRHYTSAYTEERDTYLYRAMRKYRREDFTIELIEVCENQDELDEREFYWVNYYKGKVGMYNTRFTKGKVGGDTLTGHPDLARIGKLISEKVTGGLNHQAKGVQSYDIQTGETMVFGSMSECARALGFSNIVGISRRCNGEYKKPYLDRWDFTYT